MDEPKEGATTLKKKAQEKLAAKANPVSEVSEPESPAAVEETVASEPVVEDVAVEAPADVVETPEAVVETEAPATEAAAE
jgi:small subunit ribosomal protein S16